MTSTFATLALALVSAGIAVGRIQAQTTADSVRVQVEAALALLEARASPGTIRLDARAELRASVLASLTFEALLKAGFLNTYSYRYIFRVTCGDDACILGEPLTRIHGDGHVSGDCWDDFFIRTVTERKACRGEGVQDTAAQPLSE